MESKDALFEQRKQESINISKKDTTTEVSDIAESMERLDPWTQQKQEDVVSSNEIIN